MKEYIAHRNEKTGAVQSIKEHSENTANLCRDYAVPEWKDFMYVLGLLHDVGKYQSSFSKRINGANIRVEHSTCGALAAKEEYATNPMSLMLQYCIAGHHSGIPDGGFLNDDETMNTLAGRMHRMFEDYKAYKSEFEIPNLDGNSWLCNFTEDCEDRMDIAVDKFAFLTRYAFSCLVDADSTDTANFCSEHSPNRLKAEFSKCLNLVNKLLVSFKCETELQKTRKLLQEQAFENAKNDGLIYLLNMPTGSGKTLASVKIALERLLKKEKKRIIYVIPYNSIIEQTAQVFVDVFGENIDILRHQSVYSYENDENISEDYREAAKNAMENWDAPFIITTAVQFFESIYANKRGKLRKMHNMSNSILVFDEAHLMPQDYLQPCLQAVSYITKYLNSEAIFLTATMPDYENLIREYALKNINIVNLINDTSKFKIFQKNNYNYVGKLCSESLIEKSRQYPSTLVIVNRKADARKLYEHCVGKKFHLSTYMTSFDRKKVLSEIKRCLNELEREYPSGENIPENKKITIFSTSLIEAGVDIDVYAVFRERAGLDNILQAGGRCNREGKREKADVFVFDLERSGKNMLSDEKANLTKGLMEKYEDISEGKCIKEYYNRLYFMKSDEINKNSMHQMTKNLQSIPFKKYAEKFELIDSNAISLVVPRDDISKELVNQLKTLKITDVRKLQSYTCTVYQSELDDLIKQHVVDDYGTGIYCLTNKDYYKKDVGVIFEAGDYYI